MNVVYLLFLSLALVWIEAFIGGTRLLYSLPAYGLISIAAILSLAGIRARRSPPHPFCVGSTLLLGAWILFRAAHSPVEYLALPDFFMMIGCLMVYLITAFYLTGTGERLYVILLLWVVAAAQVFIGVIQFAKDPNFMLFGLIRPMVARPSGMYVSPNNFAGFLAAVAILSLSLGVWGRWPVWSRILAIYVAFCSILGVAISGSRGGYFDVIASLIFFAIGTIYAVRLVNPRLFIPVAIGSVCGAVVIVGVAAMLMLHSSYLTHRMRTMAARDVRIFNWEAALDHIRVSPWIGTGAGTHLIYGRLFRRPEIQADPVHAHCDYLELTAEYGIVGALLMALFLTAHVARSFRSFSEILRERVLQSGLSTSTTFAIQFGVLCAVGGLAVHSIVDFDMHIPANALIFAFLFGIIAHSGMDRAPGFLDRRVTPWIKVLPPILGLFMFWRGIPLIPSEYCSEMARTDLRTRDLQTSILYAEKGIGPAANPIPPSSASQIIPTQPVASSPHPTLDWFLAKLGPNPKNPDLYFFLGEDFRAIGSRMFNSYIRGLYYKQAVLAFEAGLKVFPLHESMLVRDGQVLDGLHRYASAEAVYQTALAWDPNLGSLYDFYSKHLLLQGKKAQADLLARDRAAHQTRRVDADLKSDSGL